MSIYSEAELKIWFQLHSTIAFANDISSGKTKIGLPYPPGSAAVAKQKLREALAICEGSDFLRPIILIIATSIIHDLDKIIVQEQKL